MFDCIPGFNNGAPVANSLRVCTSSSSRTLRSGSYKGLVKFNSTPRKLRGGRMICRLLTSVK